MIKVACQILVGLLIIFLLAKVISTAVRAENSDASFVSRLEMMFGISPGTPIPVNMRAPDIRLQYRGTKPTGHGCYEVNVCRIR